ncbi:MAG TPA: YebC/PmpR family DNA-binding transcriptional regulator [Firmicutes bacterium]|nr:YebC/PmpR family DNA-binding transcriptional regulator [Bacillota bacterium]
MSGHSKWANIKRKKAKVDAQRSNIISKALRDVMLAARHGGGNPDTNFRLKMAIDKARQANVPMDSITRSVKRGTGEVEGGQIEEITYEGYGPGGVAVLAEAATDNRNRTASEIRHLFSKYGGKLAEVGAVAWTFDQRGYIVIEKRDLTEEDALEMCIEAGALDMQTEEDIYEVFTEPTELEQVKVKLEETGAAVQTAELTMLPKTYVNLDGDDASKMLTLFDLLESHDDVSRVYANFDIPEDILDQNA